MEVVPKPPPSRRQIWLIVFLALFYPTVAAQTWPYLITRLGIPPEFVDGATVTMLPRTLVLYLLALGLPLLVILPMLDWTPRDLIGVVERRWRVWIGAVVLAAGGAAVANGGWTLLVDTLGLAAARYPRYDSALTWWVLVPLALPVLREALYRGCVLRVLLSRSQPATAIAIAAMIFSTAATYRSYSVLAFGVFFFSGCVYGWLFSRSKSLLPSIAAHSMWNISERALQLSSAGAHPWEPLIAGSIVALVGARLVATAPPSVAEAFSLRPLESVPPAADPGAPAPEQQNS